MPSQALSKYPSKLYKDMSAEKHKHLKYMSPFDKNNIPPLLPQSLGNFLTVDNMTRFEVSTSTSDPILILFQPSVRGSICIAGYNLSTGASIADSGQWSTRFKYNSNDVPTVSRCLRAGIRANNISNSNTRDGVVRILQFSSPLEHEFTSASSCDFTSNYASELLSMVRSHPRARSYTAESLSSGVNELVVAQATNSSYNSYGSDFFIPEITCAKTQEQYKNAQKDMSHNNVLIVLESTASVNKYEFTGMTQDALRYPANQLLATLQKASRVDESGYIQRVHETVQGEGSALHDTSIQPIIPQLSIPQRGRSTTPAGASQRTASGSLSKKPLQKIRGKSLGASKRAVSAHSTGGIST
jgi:hypothetical protein